MGTPTDAMLDGVVQRCASRAWLMAAGVGGALCVASDPLALALAVAAFALAAFALRIALARAARRSARACEPIGRPRLLASADEMLRRCRSRQQPFSLAVVEIADLDEVRHLFGARVADAVLARVAAKLEGIAAPRGTAARIGASRFALLLPGRAAEQALATLTAGFGRGGCVEDDSADHELVLLPDFKVDAVGPEHESAAEAYDALCDAMTALLQSRAAPVVAAPPRRVPPPPRVGHYVPTIPIPLQAH